MQNTENKEVNFGKRKLLNIHWDIDDIEEKEEILSDLPSEMIIPNNIADDEAVDWASDETGYCISNAYIEYIE